MTGKFDPHCVLFQPAVMQPLADFLFKPTDFSSLERHTARLDGHVVNTPPLAIVDDTPRMHDDDQDTNWRPATHGFMTLAEARGETLGEPECAEKCCEESIEVVGLRLRRALDECEQMPPSGGEWRREYAKARHQWRELHPGEDLDAVHGDLSLHAFGRWIGGPLKITHTPVHSKVLTTPTPPGVRSSNCGFYVHPQFDPYSKYNWGWPFPGGDPWRKFDPGVFNLEFLDAASSLNAPGHSLSVRYRDKITTYDWGFARDTWSESSETTKTIGGVPLNIGSCEKIFTAIVTAQILCENGLSSLDVPIGPYLPVDTRVPAPGERSMQPGKGVPELTFRDLLRMRSGLFQYRVTRDPLYSSIESIAASPNAVPVDIQGYRFLQQDVTNKSNLGYSSADTAMVRYPLYHMSGNKKPNGPRGPMSDELWQQWIAQYDRVVGKFMADQIYKRILKPLGIEHGHWGYPEYGLSRGNYHPVNDVPTNLPLYYQSVTDRKTIRGANPWVWDMSREVGYGSLHLTSKALCQVIAALSDHVLVRHDWLKEFRVALPLGNIPFYGCGCQMSPDGAGGFYQHHPGADWLRNIEWQVVNRPTLAPGPGPGFHAQWIIYPYQNLQAAFQMNVRNRNNRVSLDTFLRAYKFAFTPFLNWI